MYIKALQLKNFKKFQDTRIEFPADITILKGKNETGKSTITEALIAALFFDPTHSSVPQYIKEYQRWRTKELYQLVLEFEANGESYILEKDFQKQRIFLKNLEDDILSHDFREISDKLREFGGYSNKNIFGNLSVIFRDSLIMESKDKKKIVERMRDMVAGTSSGASISQILKKLKKGFDDLTKGMDTSRPVKRENYGKIKMIGEGIKELQNTLQDMEERLQEKERAQEIFKEFEEKLDSFKKDLDISEREYTANKEYFSARQEIEKVNRELDAVLKDIEIFEKLIQEKNEIEKQLKATKPIGDRELEKMEEITDKIKFNQSRLGELDSKISELKAHHLKKYYPSARLTFIVSGVLILVGFVGLFSTIFFASWVLLGVFVAYMLISGKYSEPVGLRELETEKNKRENNLKEDEEKLKEMLLEFKLDSPWHIREHNKQIQEMSLKMESIEKQQKTLLRGRGIKQLKEDKREFEKQIGIEQAKITKEQKTTPPAPKRQRELEKQIDDLKKEIEKTNRKYIEAKTRVESQEISQEDITQTEEKLSSFSDSIERLKRRSKLYAIVEEVLKEAQAGSLKKTREALEYMMSEYISQITSSKYTAVKLDEEFNLRVFSPDKDDYVDISALSTGAIDQLYIVSRFAFIQLLYNPSRLAHSPSEAETARIEGAKQDEATVEKELEEGENFKFFRRPVMLLDDPFINFDEERKDNMRHVLERLAHDFQIILFTAGSDYDPWGSVVNI